MASMRSRSFLPAALASLLVAVTGCRGERLSAYDLPETQASGTAVMALASPAFADGQPIPLRHSAYGDDVSPPLAWDPVEGAASYALLVEDPDADRPEPYVHWVVWNIPAGVAALPEGLPADPRLEGPDGMQQGLNDRGTTGWFGPRPPAGSGVHHYQLQVFALDAPLDIAADADRAALVKAMRGRVLAKARLVGTYEMPAED